ncbi:hypothetical protein [Mycobacterium angelicum]|uniref:Uncharacterized protein n=1 Tax=Mycobacterium angelicum TaxID=470074 RepID=A0A1W9ZUT6_MYCAN|nr:hypothetical protein [Mycobacterium angelicum]MCV7198629.1 hypothetical protein [Mycobacterium angelicum]ORA21531.1 hypothetical protein BST12_11975 [Mycobacterium angelicum]
MNTAREIAREEILLDGMIDAVHMAVVDWHVKQQHPSASDAEIQNETLETIRSLVGDGLVKTGYRGEDGNFVPESLEQSMQELRESYVAHYDEPGEWMWSCWLELTEKGKQFAVSTAKGHQLARRENERKSLPSND